MTPKVVAAFGIAAALLACRVEPVANVPEAAPAPARSAPSALDRVPLEIRGDGRIHAFIVEIARTPDEQARGLMYRETLGANEGMIFPFRPPRPASFWMRNTLIPLDMLFVGEDGTIVRIAANTIPLSDEPVTSGGEPVAAVLELRGGRTAELGIKEGDRVSWSG